MTDIDVDFFVKQLLAVIDSDNTQISISLPSEWVEQNIIMEEPFPGLYKYGLTPYWREVINCFAVDHPMLWIAIMKGAQIGFSAGVLIPILVWSIVNDPCRIYFMVGSPELVEKATVKLDKGIDGAGIRHMIKSQVQRRRAQKSGDTNYMKEFPLGFIQIGNPNNHANIRDVSLRKGLFDDFESVKSQSKQSGSTRKMLEQRFAAYEGRHKICYGSTPEVKETSNIEPAYLLGDQRKYLTPCPCCGEFIEWKWTVTENGRTGGIYWDMDKDNKLVPGSVRYICQKCGDKFDDKNKHELLNAGYWQPTAVPSKPGYYSYHISALYAPLGMFDWEHYVNDYLEANPPGQPRDEALWKTFVNVVLGETYSSQMEPPKANTIQRNCRNYKPGTIPEQLSIKDGNGTFVILTCSVDMNGVMTEETQDVRLDYEVKGWSEAGASYSIIHGSIGTFQRGRNKAEDDPKRKRWTYEDNKENSVWPELEKIVSSIFQTDTPSKDSPTGFRRMGIQITGLDCGHFTTYAYAFLDKTKLRVIGLKGEKEQKYLTEGVDAATFKHGIERKQDYILKVGMLKDKLASHMILNWNKGKENQPSNFMNFPEPNDGLYTLENYFSHFESESRKPVQNKDGSTSYRWEKVNSAVQNHMWDCSVYNIALRDIVVHIYASLKPELKHSQWSDYVKHVLS